MQCATSALCLATIYLGSRTTATEEGNPDICVSMQVVWKLAADFSSSFGFARVQPLSTVQADSTLPQHGRCR